MTQNQTVTANICEAIVIATDDQVKYAQELNRLDREAGRIAEKESLAKLGKMGVLYRTKYAVAFAARALAENNPEAILSTLEDSYTVNDLAASWVVADRLSSHETKIGEDVTNLLKDYRNTTIDELDHLKSKHELIASAAQSAREMQKKLFNSERRQRAGVVKNTILSGFTKYGENWSQVREGHIGIHTVEKISKDEDVTITGFTHDLYDIRNQSSSGHNGIYSWSPVNGWKVLESSR